MTTKLLSKNIHQWLLLLVCFVGTLPSWAEDYTRDGIIYYLDRSAKTATVKGLEDKSATSAEIKSNVVGYEVTSIGNFAFYYCHSLTSINIPNSVTSIGTYAFGVCSSLTSINIPSSVTSIGDYAFYECSSLTSINIPNSVTSIVPGAFANCSSLTTINIPNSVTCIGHSAFRGCGALTSINIPSSVTDIGYSVFEGCSSLTSINIPNSVTSIGSGAFKGCSSLTSINIPNSVTNIEEGAFSNCDALKVALIQPDRIEFGGGVFGSNTNVYAVSDNNLEIHLLSYYNSNEYPYVNDYIGGTWYTNVTPNCYDPDGSTHYYAWNGNELDYNTAQYLRTISQTSTNAQTLISNYKAIYYSISEDLRKDLEDNLQKVDDLASIIAEGDAALFDLSTNLSKAYKNVCEAAYGPLGLSDLYKLR